jgi:hypothetical protein
MINNRIWVKRLTSLAIITVLVGSGLSLQVKPVQAASIILVTDFLGDDPTKSACTNAIDDCSLRGAIMHVNADTTVPKPDYHIQLGEFTYTLTNHGANENGNVTGDLDINYLGGTVLIEGASAATTIIDGDSADRVIEVHAGTLKLNLLSVMYGTISGTPGNGGGINSHAGTTLQLSGVQVAGNISNLNGGGIAAEQAAVLLYLSSIKDNQAPNGGGVYSSQTILQVFGAMFLNNYATTENGGGVMAVDNGNTWIFASVFSQNSAHYNYGGGIYNGAGTTMNIFDSAFIDNHAYGGAGIQASGTLNLERAYISGSTASGSGALTFGDSDFSLTDVTITNNTSINGPPAILVYEIAPGGSTGLIDHVTITGNTSSGAYAALKIVSGTVSLLNTIIHSTDGNNDCDFGYPTAFLTSSDYNIASDASCNLTQAHDHPSTDPQLNVPGYYGGMLIAEPLPGSIAIDKANPSFLPGDIDQRGALRSDGDLNGSIMPDIGAAEFLLQKVNMPLVTRP